MRIPTARGMPAVVAAAGPGSAVPGRAGPVGDAAVRGRPAVPGRHRRGPGHHLPAGQRAGSGPGRRGGPRRDPPVCGGRPGRQGLLVSGRAIRAEHRMHLADTKPRRAPSPARARNRGSGGRGGGARTGAAARWSRAGTGGGSARPSTRPPRPSSAGRCSTGSAPCASATRAACWTPAGRRHNLRLRQWQVGRLIAVLTDKADPGRHHRRAGRRAGHLLDLPRLPPAGAQTARADPVLPALPVTGHRDLVAAAIIATRTRAADPPTPTAARRAARGGHAPSSRPAPARCRPVPA